ncbi:MAG TPA: hypothetical protein VMT16_17185 [Thermoanaerobaculia bacterium]|nr:hypothetical protein [Thermoanaerobaculia bacterium]
MRRPRGLALAACVLATLSSPLMALEERREWEATYPLGSGGRLLVDLVAGELVVDGYEGTEVRLHVRETLEARSAEALAAARREVDLEAGRDGDGVAIVARGPFRDQDRRWVRGDTWQDRGYRVRYDLRLQVPRMARVDLRTVNNGDVRLRQHHGPFAVRNVNGGVEVLGAVGAGTARTVNGPLRVRFAALPPGACEFASVNGAVDVGFPSGLEADLAFQTLNGEIWSDFPYTLQPAKVAAEVDRKGRQLRRLATVVRIGGGGVDLAFETVNGNIYVRNLDVSGDSR